jgi:predicted SnoaL-like aldol condensation-catalyzing enzyme
MNARTLILLSPFGHAPRLQRARTIRSRLRPHVGNTSKETVKERDQDMVRTDNWVTSAKIHSKLSRALATVMLLFFIAPTAYADEALTERNKEIVRDFYTTVLIGRDVNAAPRFLSPGYTQHSAGIPSGRKSFMNVFRSAFAKPRPPDYKREILRVVGDNDIVIIFNRQSGTHPDGRHEVKLQFDMFRVENGMIVEHWDADPGSTA